MNNIKAPWKHRTMVFMLTGLLTLLLVWLLGFVISDLDHSQQPDLESYERSAVSDTEQANLQTLLAQQSRTGQQIAQQLQTQRILRSSTQNSRTTMQQMMEAHRLGLEKGDKPTAEEQAALAESQRLFLANQRKFQQANERIASLSTSQRLLEGKISVQRMRIDQLKKPARKKYDAALSAHQFKLAIAKLGVLLPLFVIVALAFYRYRSSPYRPLLMASLLACSWWLAMVTHDHFPSELFKYLAIGTGIAMVVFALTRLISNMAAPQLDLVLQRYREAYQRHRCPICDDPILRGPFKNAVWTRKGPILPTGVVDGADRPYTCPSCGTGLFEKCGACDTVRHALLPFCDGCGDKHTVITA